MVSLFPFLLLTFGLAWGILALYIFRGEAMTRLAGELTGSPVIPVSISRWLLLWRGSTEKKCSRGMVR